MNEEEINNIIKNMVDEGKLILASEVNETLDYSVLAAKISSTSKLDLNKK